MTFASRRAVLAAAIALPLAVALLSYGLVDEADPPQVPVRVQIGESADSSGYPPEPTGPRTSATTPRTTADRPSTTRPAPGTQVVPLPPPVGDDDEMDDDAGDSEDDDDDDSTDHDDG